MRGKKNRTKNQEPQKEANNPPTRMLARCENCKKEYIPRSRGGVEVERMKLFYISNDGLSIDKKGIVCPVHKDKTEPAGLIVSEDCLVNKFGSAMGMIGFSFSEEEILAARENQIWPNITGKIELDARVVSSMSDEELLRLIRTSARQGVSKENDQLFL